MAAGTERATAAGSERALAAGIAAGVERLIGLLRSLSPAGGLSATAAATLATLERSGPRRLTALAVQGGVTQPAMTQLIARLEDTGLVRREADPTDGRATLVTITAAGSHYMRDLHRRRADLLAEHVGQLPEAERRALLRAVPAIAALSTRPLSTEGA